MSETFSVGQRVQIKQTEENFVNGLADKAGVVQRTGKGQVQVLLDELRRGREQTIWLAASELEDEMVRAAALHDAPDSIGAAVAALESGGLVKVPDGVDPESGLTDDEAKVTEALSKFWGAYIALPEQHPNEIQEAFSHVNALQNLIAIRAARAAFPQMWPTIDVEGERRREVLGRNLKRKGRG